jgi:hypothetical protein
MRQPWFLTGRRRVAVQRHRCRTCGQTYGEPSALLVRGSWYAREVHRSAIDHWQHLGTSLRRTAEVLRSWMGQQERWRLWRPLDAEPVERCYLAASTVQRWLDCAGHVAQSSVVGQLEGLAHTDVVATDGLWAKLKGGVRRVVLLVMASASGLIYPPVIAAGEETAAAWRRLFTRAAQAGLEVRQLRGVTSDGAPGLLAYLRRGLAWVHPQRCVWHAWRSLRAPLAQAASQAVAGLPEDDVAVVVRQQVLQELGALMHQVIDATSFEAAEAALAALLAHPLGGAIGEWLNLHFDDLLVHLLAYYQGLARVAPEWVWRDFRQRLSHGRNHGSDPRLERAALAWAVYHNFEPAQWRSERQRQYRHPGQSALHLAGASPGQLSYLDALGV